ncbi:MAG TPA: glycosyltransferase family 4 protein [Gallicola sp.]|nr:glycosyltransferase family 4 protein [Gallicola sp.]
MKILISSQYFWPETFRINDLAEELQKRGHEVTVLTGKPNYPQGRFYKGYSFFTHNKDNYKGISVLRVPLFPRFNGKGLCLVLNYVSFVFFSCIYILFHRKKYDVSLTFATSPITQAYPALLHKRIYKSKAYLWVQDLWPESVVAAGKIKSNVLLKILNKIVKDIYKKSNKVLVQSKAFIPAILEKGIKKENIIYLPNWAEDLFTLNIVNNNDDQIEIPNDFIVMFAGNIGESQDFESIINAAELTKKYINIKWVIVGDGRKKTWLENEIKKRQLDNSIILLGKHPVERMPYFFQKADVMLLSLKNEEIFSKTIPSKLQSYMAFGKPVIAMINGIGKKIIDDSECGFTTNAGNYVGLAENIIKAYNTPHEILVKMGTKGKLYYHKEFEKKNIIDRLIKIFEQN